MKKKRILNVSLERFWVESEPTSSGTVNRFFQEHDERLERAYQHPPESPPVSRLVLWCQEDYRGKPCNTVLAEVYATSEGDLWEARIEGISEWDLAMRNMFPSGPRATTKLSDDLHAHHQWIDTGADPLTARCARHGRVPVDRALIANALSQNKKHLQSRGGHLV